MRALALPLTVSALALTAAYLAWQRRHPNARLRNWVWCALSGAGRHNPVRHPAGGFRCGDCGDSAADLGEWGLWGGQGGAAADGYVDAEARRKQRYREEAKG